MGKSQTQQATDMSKNTYNKVNQQTDETRGHLQGNLPGAEETARGTYNDASSAYKDYSGPTGAYDPTEYGRISGQNQQNTATGGYNNPQQLADLKGHIGQNVKSGGYTDEELSQLEMGGLGGINQGSAENIRGGYNSLINTGGISDGTADAMRRQAAGVTQSVYATAGQNLTRQQGIAGMGGAGGETAQMARQAATAGANATTGANAEIGKLKQTGTIAGLGGLSNFEENAAAGQRDVAKSAQQGRLTGTDQEQRLASDQAHNTLQATQAQQDLASGAATQRIQAAGGLVALYNSSPGYVNSLVQQIMQTQQQTGQLSAEQTQIMSDLSKNPGMFQTILGDVAQLGGAAAGIMTGVGAIKKK